MNRGHAILLSLLTAFFLGASLYQDAKVDSPNNDEDQKTERSPEELAILQSAVKFADSYNRHDAKAVAELFTEDAELVERDGTRLQGHRVIEVALTEFFKANPKAKISLEIGTLRFVTDDVAVEEGVSSFFPDGKVATSESDYRAVHIRRNGTWKMIHVRTLEDRTLSNYEHLRALEWMVGDWIDEGDDSVVETSVRWDSNRSFLIRDFTVHMTGSPVLSGTQRIGWDARRQQFRSWVFDTEGGYIDGRWTRLGDGWVVKSDGQLRDGTPVSGTTRIDRLDDNRFVWSAFDRIRGEELMPDIEVMVVRRPPKPEDQPTGK